MALPSDRGPNRTESSGIGELESTLENEIKLNLFRTFLRTIDGKSRSVPEDKGRFERNLDFVLACQALFSLNPESTGTTVRDSLLSIYSEFFDCELVKRLAVSRQHNLRVLMTHCFEMKTSRRISPQISLIRPVFEDSYRKVQSKHNYWKLRVKHTSPSVTLRVLACVLS